jgi:hypothetical protein
MAIQTTSTLKGYFQSGEIPTQENYSDFIDTAAKLSLYQPGTTGSINDQEGTLRLTGSIDVSNTSSIGSLLVGTVDDLATTSSTYIGIGYGTSSLATMNTASTILMYNQSTDTTSLHTTGSGTINFNINPSLGNTVDVSITSQSVFINNNITASGEISASSTIHANAYRVGSNVPGMAVDTSVTPNAVSVGSTVNALQLNGNITASANISASGIQNVLGGLTIPGNGGLEVEGNTVLAVVSASGNVTMNGAIINSHITSSGNISSSGEMYTSQFKGARPITNITGDYPLSSSNSGQYHRCGGHLITIPLNTAMSTEFETNTEMDFVQTSSVGHLMITASSGVTLNSRHQLFSASGQFSAITVKKVGDNEYDMFGDLTR